MPYCYCSELPFGSNTLVRSVSNLDTLQLLPTHFGPSNYLINYTCSFVFALRDRREAMEGFVHGILIDSFRPTESTPANFVSSNQEHASRLKLTKEGSEMLGFCVMCLKTNFLPNTLYPRFPSSQGKHFDEPFHNIFETILHVLLEFEKNLQRPTWPCWRRML